MAIAQDRYVKITSTNVNDSTVADRDLGGLVFTKTAIIKVYDEQSGTWKSEAFSQDMFLECFNASQVANRFGSDSDEYNFALEYFAYMSPSGRAPTKLSFVNIGENEAPVDALERINKDSNNFGSFCFLQGGDYTCEQMKDVVVANDGYNYKYLFSLAFPFEAGGDESSSDESAATGDTEVKDATAKAFQKYLSGSAETPSYTGYCLSLGRVKDEDDKDVNFNYAAMMPMTIFASTDYNRANTATFFMFKQFDTQLATVSSDEVADVYDSAFVNYVGLVQVNGRRRAFFQRGVNGNGEGTAIYCNEVWLKSRIATDIIDLMLSVERIPANEDGELIISNLISADAEIGINNGVIERNKTLTADQRRKVYNLTQDNEAYRQIEQGGYYLEVTIEKGTRFNTEEYKAIYRLIYAKGDAICAVEGTHLLV